MVQGLTLDLNRIQRLRDCRTGEGTPDQGWESRTDPPGRAQLLKQGPRGQTEHWLVRVWPDKICRADLEDHDWLGIQ